MKCLYKNQFPLYLIEMGKKMTSEAAARIQSAEAKKSGGKVEKGNDKH